MKKITFLILTFIVSISLNAQIATSFEASEGFILGEINGQNGWTSNAGGEANVVITDSQSSDGDFSVQLVPSNTGNLTIGFSPLEASTQDVVTVTVDMFVESSTGALSTVEFVTQTPLQGLLTTRVAFNPDDTVTVLDDDGAGGLAFAAAGPFTRDVWFEFRIEHRFADNEILYFIDDTLIYTSIVIAGTIVEQALPLFNDLESGAFYDNIRFMDGTLSVNDNSLSESISLFPNPTNGDVNLNFSRSFGATNVDIINVNGQKVLNASLEGVGNNTLATSKLASGIYFAQISNETGSTTIKFIKS